MMNSRERKHSILVITSDPVLISVSNKINTGNMLLDFAVNPQEAREKIRNIHPDFILLGNSGSSELTFKYYNELKSGWISRHSTIIVVYSDDSGKSYYILSEENISLKLGKFTLISGESSTPVNVQDLPAKLAEVLADRLKRRTNQLKNSILDPNIFCLTWEQIPGQGAFETRQELVLENASKAARGGKICAISIVDNPGGNPAIATEVLCSEIRKLGIEPMVHLAFRDKSRNQVESLLYQLAALDINNLLILTGDYPSNIGFQGKSRPVFDLDAVNGLQLVKEMNLGMEHEIMRRKTRLSPTDFFAGVAFSPFKRDEAEVMGQYYKLMKKIRAGADFIITQIGYDVRKLHELKQWLQIKNIDIPVLTSIHVLSYVSARAMHDNRVPGCVVTDKLMSEITDEVKSPDKGLEASLLRAAKLYAISKGMGFAGACISGQGISYENVEFIIEKGNEFTYRWQELIDEFDYPQKNGFYYFEKNSATGLNNLTPSPRRQKPARPVIFFLSKLIHVLLFEPRSPLFKPLRFVMARIDSSRILKKAFASVEFWIKAMLYGCMNCGDCALFDVAYLCPVSQCPKNQRNGPCGGSYNGWCEVYPEEKKCIWVRAYQRLKAVGKEEVISQNIVPPCDWELWQTSSWLNYFLGRDHISRRIGIKPVKAKNKSGKN